MRAYKKGGGGARDKIKIVEIRLNMQVRFFFLFSLGLSNGNERQDARRPRLAGQGPRPLRRLQGRDTGGGLGGARAPRDTPPLPKPKTPTATWLAVAGLA